MVHMKTWLIRQIWGFPSYFFCKQTCMNILEPSHTTVVGPHKNHLNNIAWSQKLNHIKSP